MEQTELFQYSDEDIERLKIELAADVVKMNSLEDEKAEIMKSYSDGIKLLKLQIRSKAAAIRQYKKSQTQKIRSMAE